MSPMVLVAFANELMTGVPPASDSGQSGGADSLFATVLMDTEAMPQKDAAAATPTPASAKMERPSWLTSARPVSLADWAPPEEVKDVERDLTAMVFAAPAASNVATQPWRPFGLPEFTLAQPVIVEAEPTAHGLNGPPIGGEEPSCLNREHDGSTVTPVFPAIAMEEVEDDEKAATESGQAVIAHSLPQPEPDLHRIQMARAHADVATATPAEPPSISEATPNEPLSAPVPERRSEGVQHASRTHQPVAANDTPTRIALDVFIRPEAKPTEETAEVSPPVTKTSVAPLTADADTGRQSFADTSDQQQADPDPSSVELPTQRHMGSETAGVMRDHVVAERSASPASPTRETTHVPRTEYVEPKEPVANAASAPLKRMEVRIPDPQSNVVVQVQEHKGAVQVTVRTDDARTAGDIAAHLPELTRDLGQQGFRAETWTPDTAVDGNRHGLKSVSAADTSEHADAGSGERSQNKRDWETDSEQRRRKAPQEEIEEYLW